MSHFYVLFSCRGFHSYSETIDHYHKGFELSRFTKIASKQLCVLKCSLSQLGIVFHIFLFYYQITTLSLAKMGPCSSYYLLHFCCRVWHKGSHPFLQRVASLVPHVATVMSFWKEMAKGKSCLNLIA